MPKIKTTKGLYCFKNTPLFAGRKKIDKGKSKENLCVFNRLANKQGLFFGLVYGTLLGAVREKDFIEHDEDIDIFILEESKELLMGLLFELRNEGFEVVRYDRRGLVSIMRNNEYIDIYIFKKFRQGVRICCGECILERFLLETTEISFLEGVYFVPKDYIGFLVFQYGTHWSDPVVYSDFSRVNKWNSFLCWFKEEIKSALPDCMFYLWVKKNEDRFIESFYKKAKLNNIAVN